VSDAIRFQAERDWDAVRDRCRELTGEARRQLCDLLGTKPIEPLSESLFERHRVEIPIGGPEKTSCGSPSLPTRRATRSTGC
jgi:hypothetical protein